MRENPHQRYCLVGFSLGGNFVTNIVADRMLNDTNLSKIKAVFAIQPPFNLIKAQKYLENELRGFHNIGFLVIIK